MRLTLQEVRELLANIESQQHDSEIAHGLEDQLFADVLTAIAEGADDAPALAAEALKSLELDFPRWTS